MCFAHAWIVSGTSKLLRRLLKLLVLLLLQKEGAIVHMSLCLLVMVLQTTTVILVHFKYLDYNTLLYIYMYSIKFKKISMDYLYCTLECIDIYNPSKFLFPV